MASELILVLVSLLSGVILLWVFARTSNQTAIRETKNRLQARLLEMRLYADDPRVFLAAQKAMLAANLRYFLLMLRPAVFATVPMVVLLIGLDAYYGRRPLVTGQTASVTVQLRDAPAAAPTLTAPDGIAIESGPVRALHEGQVSWRLRPERAASGELRLSLAGGEATKKIDAGNGWGFHAARKVSSLWEWLLNPAEPRLNSADFEWIEVTYPEARVELFGLRTHWLVWFLLFSMGSAFALKGKFRVTI